jgi:hypothetical protein
MAAIDDAKIGALAGLYDAEATADRWLISRRPDLAEVAPRPGPVPHVRL